jgi:hypothetical protein
MGYYVRVLSTSDRCVPLAELQSALKEARVAAELSLENGTVNAWLQLILKDADGIEIASIERNSVEVGSLADDELKEFAEEIRSDPTRSGGQWLLNYFTRLRTIYAFQLLSGSENDDGLRAIEIVRNRLWSSAPSILQADHEGFTNEAGEPIA